MERGWIGLAFALTFLPCLAQSPLGRIEGTVQTEAGQPIRGARIAAAPVQPPPDGSLGQPYFAISAPDGTFVLDQVPANVYSMCGQIVGSELLDPCIWSATPTTADLSAGGTRSGISITLAQGRFVHVRIADSAQLLHKADKGESGAQPFSMYVMGPRGPISLVPVVDDDNGRTFRTVVPFGTRLKLQIVAGTFAMQDKAGKPLSKGIVQPPPLNGKPQPPVQSSDFQHPFKISKADAPLTFEFTVTQP
jgi:hypothetical protein